MAITMSISLPDALKRFVDEQVAGGRYGTSSEYIGDLIRKDQYRERLRAMLLEGVNSPAEPVDEAFFAELRRIASGDDRPASDRRE